MQIPTQTKDQFISSAVETSQSASNSNLSFDVGSVGLALLEGNIQNWLVIQAQLVLLSAAIRLSTCQLNADVDSFIADFGLSREPAVAAVGNLVFSRYTPTLLAVVPVGAFASTVTGTRVVVTLDETNSNYNQGLNGYVLNPSVSSITVPAQALVAGANGNAAENTVNLIAQAMPGVDTVNNPARFSGGEDQETNDQVKKRFALYFASLSRANREALEYSLTILQENLKYKLTENLNYSDNATDYGQFYAVIDGGNGTASTDLLASAYANLDRYRAFCVRPSVYSSIALPVTIAGDVTIKLGADATQIIESIILTLTNFISDANNITVGSTLKYNRLAGLVYDITPDILVVNSITVNGGTSDIVSTYKQSIVVSSITFTASS
jgi:hypothetical protein